MKISIDTRMLNKTAKRAARSYKAVAVTLSNPGQGEVVVSKRNRMLGDPPGRVPHGKFLANSMAKDGHDPFVYPSHTRKRVNDRLARQISQAQQRAFKSGRYKTSDIKEALTDAAQTLADWAYLNITSGRLGQNTGDYGKLKQRWQDWGKGTHVTMQYPMHYGIKSGRFLHGIKARWKLGRKAITGGGYRADSWLGGFGATTSVRFDS